MTTVSTYLEFKGSAEDAFNFYKSVFNSEFQGEVMRWGDMPPQEDSPHLNEEQKRMIMHVSLPILNGHFLLGTDALDLVGPKLTMGNNVNIVLNPDTREETKKLFDALSEGGEVTMELEDMFWGGHFGSCVDKFGVCWMFNCTAKK